MISNVNSLAIVTSSICKPRAIVMSHRSIVLTLYLWTLSSSQWHCQPGRFSMAAHRHGRREIYRCVLLRFRGRIEIDHSYGLRCHGLCCHCRHSTCGAGRRGRATTGPTRAVPAVAAQTTPAQTVSWSIPIIINSSYTELYGNCRNWTNAWLIDTIIFLKYIPWNMHTVLFCIVLWSYYQFIQVHVMCLPISKRAASLVLGNLTLAPVELSFKDMDKID